MNKIVEGYINYIKDKLGHLPEKERKEVIKRAELCRTCELFSGGFCSPLKSKDGINGCGCFIEAKIRSFSTTNKCPLNKW